MGSNGRRGRGVGIGLMEVSWKELAAGHVGNVRMAKDIHGQDIRHWRR